MPPGDHGVKQANRQNESCVSQSIVAGFRFLLLLFSSSFLTLKDRHLPCRHAFLTGPTVWKVAKACRESVPENRGIRGKEGVMKIPAGRAA